MVRRSMSSRASPDRSRRTRTLRSESGDIQPRVWSLPLSVNVKASKLKTSELIGDGRGSGRPHCQEGGRRGFAGIVEAAKKGEEVSLPSFGKFKVKDSAARQGRNPGTGETIEIAASRKLGFSPAKQVKDLLAA
jgi:DNA-binding protein HU-beta